MTTSNPDTVWVAHASEEHEEADEPPELLPKQRASNNFQRSIIRRPNEQSSLLTKAIMGTSDDDINIHPSAYTQSTELSRPILANSHRRRSMASNISVASTADLTSDTGLTSPSRPNTPSPPLPEMSMLCLNRGAPGEPKNVSLIGAAVRYQGQPDAVKEVPRKRCIQFACAKPVVQQPAQAQPMAKTPSAQEAPRRTCIKFACPARPASTQNTPPKQLDTTMAQAAHNAKPESPSTPRRTSALSAAAVHQSLRQPMSRRPSAGRPAFLRANSKDLATDGSHFHEFASGISREDDWILNDNITTKTRLTINDTLTKENHIRRLATEAEEEEALEDEDAEAAIDDEEEDVDELEANGDDYDDDDSSSADEEDDDSDGYHTDEETGFAASDNDEDDDDDNMAMWTPNQKSVIHHTGSYIPKLRRPSLYEQHSDSSTATRSSQNNARRTRSRRIKPQNETPDLPDSTDFVCGTLDEDRPLEEAYLSCMAARRNEKLRLIPQDIDPSFPASDPEDEEEEIYNPVLRDSDEEQWLHGEMEDLDQGNDRTRRRRKSEHASPKRYRSPPPKRHHSPPPPRVRGRSPKPLFDAHSPRKPKSPTRKAMTTPLGSPRCGQIKFNLAGRPGLTHTKSLPRAGAIFSQMRVRRQHKINYEDDLHIRGAIDIVKGLEQKRQRRKEKFHQKYCNRARRGQIPERKPQPGRGAERMRELGLLMAGKKDPGNYVLSI
ncbi:hypothetical protein G7046_g938 [Stylonectria norvegica]|nr:hypothetical protein G7046_g938 [Stylonectria norvegica]